MADRFTAEIRIGGKVKRARIPALIQAINAEQLQQEWGKALPEITTEDQLLSHRNEKGVLWFCNEEQAWGQFEDLEEFLRESGIPFNRGHDPRYDSDGELALFRPGMKEPRYCVADASGALMVAVEKIQNIRDLLKRNPAKTGVQRALRKLNALCEDADIEPLPEFEIVE